MCGIAGSVGPGGTRAQADPRQSLRHRGPDSDGRQTWSDGRVTWTLTHTRLSINDLSDAANQPMANEDGSLVMVFNGEIYNCAELRSYCESKGHIFRSQMDGEVILHLWEMEGAACLARLNGIFAVAVASAVSGEVVLARDPLGVKPLYYWVGGDSELWFASEPAAVEATALRPTSPDPVALAQFLTFLWIPAPRSPRAEISALRPGEALRWTQVGLESFTYAEPLGPRAEAEPISRLGLLDQTEEQLKVAATRQLLADVPIGLMASGGVDSGLLWWAGAGSLKQAYTIAWAGQDDEEGLDDDRLAVMALEGRFGTPVEYVPGQEAADVLPPSGDLFADPAYNLTRLIARRARDRGQKVLWSGQGGDELFAGYRRHTIAPLLSPLGASGIGETIERIIRRVPSRKLANEYVSRLAIAAREKDPFRGYMQLCSYSTPAERAAVLGCTEAEVSNDVVWQEHQRVYDSLPTGLSFLRRVMTVDLRVYLPGLGLAYADRAGMEFGVEVRVPWLDLDLVRWSLALPDEALLRWGRGKWLPRELASRVLTKQLAHRPKRGFAAPSSRVKSEVGHGARGHRQGAYFARARRMMETYLGQAEKVA